MRKLLCFLLGAVVAMFALPGVAGNDKKGFSIAMSVPDQAPPPFAVVATITSEGNSTINSFKVFLPQPPAPPAPVTIVGVAQPATGSATFTGSTVSVKNMHPLKSGQSLSVTIYLSTCGDVQWAGATAWTGSSLNGQSFNLDLAGSSLETDIPCGDVANGDAFTVLDSLNPCLITGQRGLYDKDGNKPNVAIPYFVTNTLNSDEQVHFRWPDIADLVGNDPAAAFEYNICSSGPLPPRDGPGATEVAWLNMEDGSPVSEPGTPAFIPALDCIPPSQGDVNDPAVFLPVPYGTLVASVGAGDTTITVDTSQGAIPPPLLPHANSTFDIIIGTERMTVIACKDGDDLGGGEGDASECGESGEPPQVWTVTRAVGGTTATQHTVNPDGPSVMVMYTPLPLLPADTGFPYQTNPPGGQLQAQMCIAKRVEAPDHSQHTTSFIDIGDGGLRLP
jgi:hypothetical protein